MPSLVNTANEVYYNSGETILTDQEFDLLADNGLDIDSRNFRTKVEHRIPMMSLDKSKTAPMLHKFATERMLWDFSLSPKLDGNSIALSYLNGILVRAVTRGDGRIGSDVTDNIMRTKVRKELPFPFTGEVSAEAILPKSLTSSYGKNLRNVVAGMIGAKDSRPELEQVEVVAFDVYGEGLSTYAEKQRVISVLNQGQPEIFSVMSMRDIKGVLVSWARDGEGDPELRLSSETLYQQLEQGPFAHYHSDRFPYTIDGLVLQVLPDGVDTILPEPAYENPKDKIAVKFSKDAHPAIIGAIEWNLGKHDKLTPVLVLEKPVEIDGTSVQRISASNYNLLKAAGLGIGASIGVVKSGDIIPFVKEIYEKSHTGLDLPNCPCCQTQAGMSDSGVDALCLNGACEGTTLVQLQQAFEVFGIEFVSDATIESLVKNGHDSLEKIFALSERELQSMEGFGAKTAKYIVASLAKLSLTEAQVVKLTGLKGIGERKAGMLLDAYGTLDNAIASIEAQGMKKIDNFGPIQMNLLTTRIDRVRSMFERLKDLGVKIEQHQAAPTGGIEVCCTGTCLVDGQKYGRKELEQLLADNGYKMATSVTKACAMVICEDAAGNSSKLQAARKSGLPIKSYEDFFYEDLNQGRGPRP